MIATKRRVFFCVLAILFALGVVGSASTVTGASIAPDVAAISESREPRQGVEPSVQGPVVARVFFADQVDLNALARELDIWEVNHTRGYLVAPLSPQRYMALLQAGYQLEVDQVKTALLDRPLRPLSGQTSGIPGYPCYRTVEETYADLAQLAADHPDLADWIDIGNSWDKETDSGPPGYDLYVLVLANRAVPGPKPKLFLVGAIHARELSTAELAARFAEHLVADYGVDPDVTWLLDYNEVHVLPIANPDGRKWAEGGYYWRKNTDDDDGCTVHPLPYRYGDHYGTDLNRNSSFHWGGASSDPCSELYQGPAAASEPETQAVQDYVASIFPDQRGPGDESPAPDEATGVFITLHSYGPLVLFPYGFRPAAAPNDAQLETLGRKFGYFNDYVVCQSGEPSCIYLTTGTTDDWAYGELGVAAYTFELGENFFENCSYFQDVIVPDNMPALMYAAKAARRPYQTPAGPEAVQVVVTPTIAFPGSVLTLTATADDTRYDSNGWGDEPVQTIGTARYTVDAPSWVTGVVTYPLSAADGAFGAPVEAIQAVVDTMGWAIGRHLIMVEAQDMDGNWGVPGAAFVTITGAERIYLPLAMR